jgi:hypothetical protein
MTNTRDLIKLNAEKIAITALSVASKTNDWQVVKEYISSRVENFPLTDKQKELFEVYNFCYANLISGKYNSAQLVNVISKKYACDVRHAQNYLNATKEIYDTTLSLNKGLELSIELEVCRKHRNMCVDRGDLKTAEAYSKTILSILKEIKEKEDANLGFEGIFIEATFDPTLLGVPLISRDDIKDVLVKINQSRNKKLDLNLFLNEIPLTDCEIIENEKDTETLQ